MRTMRLMHRWRLMMPDIDVIDRRARGITEYMEGNI